ncbi:MAG: hypothetical protein LUI14_13535 [Lachnospiraceae bacterium]|nr:hypothetical protein [Lachnospiraceae bacterium]
MKTKQKELFTTENAPIMQGPEHLYFSKERTYNMSAIETDDIDDINDIPFIKEEIVQLQERMRNNRSNFKTDVIHDEPLSAEEIAELPFY